MAEQIRHRMAKVPHGAVVGGAEIYVKTGVEKDQQNPHRPKAQDPFGNAVCILGEFHVVSSFLVGKWGKNALLRQQNITL